jgi:hypothetical protein
MTVKGNMPTLYRQLKKLPWSRIPSASSVSTDHGRRARRTIKAALAPPWIEFAGAAQVAQVRRTVTKKGKEDRRGCLPHHQRPRCQPSYPGRLDPRPLGDRKQAPLGSATSHTRRTNPRSEPETHPRHGNAAEPGHQPPATGGPRQHRRRQPPPRPRPSAHAKAAPDRMNDLAVSLANRACC